MKDIVKHYIELALREEISYRRPDYPKSLADDIVKASLTDEAMAPRATKDIFCRAIELAASASKIEAFEEAKKIIGSVPFENWWQAGRWMDKYGRENE
jgi:hypothetical protein